MSRRWREQPVKTLLVDLDGTLLGSFDRLVRLEFVARSLWGVSRQPGLKGGLRAATRSLKAVRLALEQPAPEEKHLLNSVRASRAFAHESGLSFEQADRVLRQEVGAIFPKLERYFFKIQGAADFLAWAAPRYKLVLATNPVWPIEQVLLRLRWAGIDPSIFASITHSDRMHACKPSADYYQELLEQEGLMAQDCALIGDDIRKDLPATRVGVSVFILAPRGFGKKRPSVENHGGTAAAVCGTYRELADLLEPMSSVAGGLVV